MLLCCQLAGEFLVRLVDAPVPGPVVGMVVLLVALQVREPDRDGSLVRVAEGLLRHLQLLFVPAGVGVIQYLGVLGAFALPVTVGLLLSWFAGLVVAALVAAGLLALGERVGAQDPQRRTTGGGA